MTDLQGIKAYLQGLVGEEVKVFHRFYDMRSPISDEELQVTHKSLEEHPLTVHERWMRFPSSQASSGRRQEWLESRRLLLEALGVFPVGEEFIYTSLAHTRLPDGTGRVFLLLWKNSSLSLGVDLEKKDRVISEKASIRILSESEREKEVSVLEAWVAKEACVKAYRGKEAPLISEIKISSWDSRQHSGRLIFQQDSQIDEFDVRLFCRQGVYFGIAYAISTHTLPT